MAITERFSAFAPPHSGQAHWQAYALGYLLVQWLVAAALFRFVGFDGWSRPTALPMVAMLVAGISVTTVFWFVNRRVWTKAEFWRISVFVFLGNLVIGELVIRGNVEGLALQSAFWLRFSDFAARAATVFVAAVVVPSSLVFYNVFNVREDADGPST